MDNIWTIAFLTSVLAAAVPAGTAILYAALGETFAERPASSISASKA